MSIDRETFDESSEEELAELSVPDTVLGFLAANDGQAFEAAEIASRTGLAKAAVSTALTRLKERALVEHKATYWAVTRDEERLRSASGYERATRLFNDRLGEEDQSEWREEAPEEAHPSVGEER